MERIISLSEVRMLVGQARLSENEVGEIMVKSGSTDRFNLILEALAEYAKENPEAGNGFQLIEAYQQRSRFQMEEWLESLDYFYAWLGINERYSSLPAMLGYMEGMIQKQNNNLEKSLREQLEEMLDNYCLEV